MKKVALMQPYLFPYLGYFQLINAVDLFVVYDDVQWIKGGWINRNRILESNEPAYITLPIKKDSLTKHINERYFTDNFDTEKKTIIERIKKAYEGAPHVNATIALLEEVFSYTENNAALFLENSIKVMCNYLGIQTEIILSSSIEKNPALRSQDRVIDIIERVNAEQYINAIGGQELYDKDTFLEHGIKLSFIKSTSEEYEQFGEPYVPYLSIIDVLMFNPPHKVKEMLNHYELI